MADRKVQIRSHDQPIINPRHRNFDAIATGNVRPFVFDERLIG